MAFLDLFPLSQQAQGGVLLSICICCWALNRSWGSKLPYPPGPPPKNLLSGNLADLPPKRAWVTYLKWAETYCSDIIHFRVFGQHIVVLNSLELAKELLEKRSNIYSDRPYNAMIDLMEWDIAAGMKPYGAEWRHHRRLFQQAFRTGPAAFKYRPIQTEKVKGLLFALLNEPDEFRNHCKALAASVIMRVIYGYDTAPKEDYFVELSEAAMAKMCDSWVVPGATVVNTLPILRHTPSWFPGATFKKYAIEGQQLTRKIRDVPFAFTAKSIVGKIASGTAHPSIVSELLANGEDQETIKEVAATGYGAGADTSMAALASFLYSMTLHPEAQKKAQEELDRVVGNDRLPAYEDRDSLPYVEALFLEVLRWRPVTPLGLLHATTYDDVYNGYYIPKGAIVMANIWAIAYDKNAYENPKSFNPDRYLDNDGNIMNDGTHSDVWSFGFGRRVCPGRQLASDTIWLSIATILATFNIQKKKDDQGNEIPVDEDIEVADGLVSHPAPFACSVTPRSEAAKRTIMEACGN